jgi:site-specific recombinase XerD
MAGRNRTPPPGLIPASGEAQRLRVLDAAVNRWLMQHAGKTRRTYAQAWQRAQRAYPALDPALTPDDARACVRALEQAGYSAATVDLTVRALAALWGYWQAQGWVRQNPWHALRLAPPPDRRLERRLTEAEVDRLIAAAGSGRNALFLRFLYLTGCRISEAVSVRWGDLFPAEQGEGILRVVGKGRKEREIRLPAGLMADLRRWRQGDGPEAPIWPFSAARGWQIVRRAAERAGLGKRVSPHWLRHAHATHAIAAGVPLHVVQQTLGHARLDTTGEYLHVLPGQGSALALAERWRKGG